MNLKKNLFHKSHIYNIYVMFYYETTWFYQNFKNENLCFLNQYSVDAARILHLSLEVMLSTPKWGTKHLYKSKGFPFMLEQVYFYFLGF